MLGLAHQVSRHYPGVGGVVSDDSDLSRPGDLERNVDMGDRMIMIMTVIWRGMFTSESE